MKHLSEDNSFKVKKTNPVSLKLVASPDDIALSERKTRAYKILADSKLYISSKILTEDLKEHVEALKAQDDKLTTLETIVMLLDYTEREFAAIEKLENTKVSRLKKLSQFFRSLLR